MDKWAPTIGSGLIALATLIVLAVTVRQNREALNEARTREHAEWERNTFSENTAKALEAASRLENDLRTSMTREVLERGFVARLEAEVASIYSSAAVLRLFADGSLARKCSHLAVTARGVSATWC